MPGSPLVTVSSQMATSKDYTAVVFGMTKAATSCGLYPKLTDLLILFEHACTLSLTASLEWRCCKDSHH